MTDAPATLAFRRLLVIAANDDSDAALFRRAGALAEAWGAGLDVLHVVEPPTEIDRIAKAIGLRVADLESRLEADARTALSARLADALPDVPAKLHIQVGKTFIEIIRLVEAQGADLVLKAAEMLGGNRSGLFASTDQHLLRKCPCPVWLVPPSARPRVATILAAVDVDTGQATAPKTLEGLNEVLIDTVVRLAVAERRAGQPVEVHLLHVWDAPGEGMVRLWSDSSDPTRAVDDYVGAVEATHWTALGALAEAARTRCSNDGQADVAVRPTLLRGKPREVIPAQAVALDADLLVIGTIARTGVPGLIIGNTAEDVLNTVECAVVTVKPPGFISPLSRR